MKLCMKLFEKIEFQNFVKVALLLHKTATAKYISHRTVPEILLKIASAKCEMYPGIVQIWKVGQMFGPRIGTI